MNLILEHSDKIKYFTNMQHVFCALGNICEDYDWYVSDLETNFYKPDVFNNADKWITGEDLNNILNKYEIQFIWAVFSAFKKGTKFEISKSPYVEDNPVYWSGKEPNVQLKDAEFEIACWDSSGTILVGINNDQATKFCKIYLETKNLIDAAR